VTLNQIVAMVAAVAFLVILAFKVKRAQKKHKPVEKPE
jgi:uncharacterized protein YoxC